MSAPKPPRSGLLTFQQYLDDRLEDARIMNQALKKLNRLYELNAESVTLSEEQADNPLFPKLTLASPPIDRQDPLGYLRGWTEAAAAADSQPPHPGDDRDEPP